MRTEDILAIFQRACKAADLAVAASGSSSSEAEQRCISALKELTGVRYPLRVIKDTDMGRRLAEMDNHSSEKIREMSGKVIDAMVYRLYEGVRGRCNCNGIIQPACLGVTAKPIFKKPTAAKAQPASSLKVTAKPVFKKPTAAKAQPASSLKVTAKPVFKKSRSITTDMAWRNMNTALRMR